jgi:hypothetical protein
MTNQHPLTEEMIQDIDLRYRSAAFWECHGFEDVSVYEQKNIALCMRAVADWQLKQCVAWLEGYEPEGWAAEQMKKDLRPTQEDK